MAFLLPPLAGASSASVRAKFARQISGGGTPWTSRPPPDALRAPTSPQGRGNNRVRASRFHLPAPKSPLCSAHGGLRWFPSLEGRCGTPETACSTFRFRPGFWARAFVWTGDPDLDGPPFSVPHPAFCDVTSIALLSPGGPLRHPRGRAHGPWPHDTHRTRRSGQRRLAAHRTLERLHSCAGGAIEAHP
jgi:hypothetical protein